MSKPAPIPRGKDRPRSAPLFVRWRRLVERVARPLRRRLRLLRIRWLAGSKVVRVQKWRFTFSWATLLQRLTVLPALLFVVWVGFAIWGVVRGVKGPVERRCASAGSSCGVVIGFASPFLSLALAATVFLAYRYWRIRRPIVRKARRKPERLVLSAGSITEEVVGRSELCEVISQSLRMRSARRPYLLVGGVGAGKTAVLVQLTRSLAEKGAVPVPIRLRDVGTDGHRLDFWELAKQRFCEETDPGLLSAEQSAKVWRQLCKDGRAVVLADGLEEALPSEDGVCDRDNLIRGAIRQAERRGLPLVIASRPHAPLEDAQAVIIDLEPLSEEAALDYLIRTDPEPDLKRLDWIVETAVVSESPLYLQLARQLRQHHLLPHVERSKEWDQLDTRSHDSSTLRLWLLQTWENALVEGHLQEQVAVTPECRRQTVEAISAFAYLGLLNDRLEVGFDELLTSRDPRVRALVRPVHQDPNQFARLLPLNASRGEQLGLVEAFGNRVRFPHSILQAYLGSRLLEVGSVALRTALFGEPGRELLIALVLRSCDRTTDLPEGLARLLVAAARRRRDAKACDLYAAALEIDTHAQKPIHWSIADTLAGQWSTIDAGDRRTLDEARQRLVHRFGEALRKIDHRQAEQYLALTGGGFKILASLDKAPAYDAFFRIAEMETYSVRLSIAQEIGAGGDAAFGTLRRHFMERGDQKAAPEAGVDPVLQYNRKIAKWLAAEVDYADSLGHPVTDADQRAHEKDHREERQRIWREYATRAWLAPMLVGSVSPLRRTEAKDRLGYWLKHLDPERSGSGRADLPLSLEVALALGFKSAANRRIRHRDTYIETREYLVEQAESMLTRARYWFTQLTLIHALCLWELPDFTGRDLRPEDGDQGRRRPCADPRDAVQRWLGMAGTARAPAYRREEDRTRRGERLHPFVDRAARMAVLALETGRPEQFIWIDEKGVMEQVGSFPGDPRVHRKHNLWIPPSVGWTTLDPRAQQLLADVLILLNLTERQDAPEDLDQRLERACRNSLPPCLTRDRRPLQPHRTVGMAEIAEPGNTCLRDCPFELCPYPAKGERPPAELREVFCRQQEALLAWHHGWLPVLRRKRAPWQGMTAKDLRAFWRKMAVRTRTPGS